MNMFTIDTAPSEIIESGLTEKVACAKAKELSIKNQKDIYTVRKEGSCFDGKSWSRGKKIPPSVGLTGYAW